MKKLITAFVLFMLPLFSNASDVTCKGKNNGAKFYITYNLETASASAQPRPNPDNETFDAENCSLLTLDQSDVDELNKDFERQLGNYQEMIKYREENVGFIRRGLSKTVTKVGSKIARSRADKFNQVGTQILSCDGLAITVRTDNKVYAAIGSVSPDLVKLTSCKD